MPIPLTSIPFMCPSLRPEHAPPLPTSAHAQTPAYVKDGSQTTNVSGTPAKDYGAESTFDKATNSIQYTTVAKFPPVKLLPNAERKRILGAPSFVHDRDAVLC